MPTKQPYETGTLLIIDPKAHRTVRASHGRNRGGPNSKLRAVRDAPVGLQPCGSAPVARA